jgi:hypothetical protein
VAEEIIWSNSSEEQGRPSKTSCDRVPERDFDKEDGSFWDSTEIGVMSLGGFNAYDLANWEGWEELALSVNRFAWQVGLSLLIYMRCYVWSLFGWLPKIATFLFKKRLPHIFEKFAKSMVTNLLTTLFMTKIWIYHMSGIIVASHSCGSTKQ